AADSMNLTHLRRSLNGIGGVPRGISRPKTLTWRKHHAGSSPSSSTRGQHPHRRGDAAGLRRRDTLSKWSSSTANDETRKQPNRSSLKLAPKHGQEAAHRWVWKPSDCRRLSSLKA